MYRIYLYNKNIKELKHLKKTIKNIINNSEYFKNAKLFCIKNLNETTKVQKNSNFEYWNIYIVDISIYELYALQKIKSLDYCCFIIPLIDDENIIIPLINSTCSALDIIIKSDTENRKNKLENCFDIIHKRTKKFSENLLQVI